MSLPDESDEFLHTLLSRRSLRRYEDRQVAKRIIEQVLTAGIWAPSAHNRQPWRFAVIQSFSQKHDLASKMGARLREDLSNDGVGEAIIDKDVNRSYSRMTQAPVLIVVCMSMVDMDHYPDDKRNLNERIMTIQSVAMAGQNILLAAHHNGLGACWMCAPLFCPDVVRDALTLPDDWEPQGIITMGYPAQERQRERKALETSVMWR